MEPIKLTATLRVNDYDAQQYTIERLTVAKTGKNAGQSTWKPIAYCGAVKTLAQNAREAVGNEFARLAKEKAEESFDAQGLSELLSNLPTKPRAIK